MQISTNHTDISKLEYWEYARMLAACFGPANGSDLVALSCYGQIQD
jgi:hypothetical protein